MNIKTVWAVYFSGTGTTEKVATTLARDLAERLEAAYDTDCFNLPQAREKDLSFGPEDLVVLGTPVYAGRVPNLLMPYVRDHIKGNGTLGVSVVLYGNRNYDDGLIELRVQKVEGHEIHCEVENGGPLSSNKSINIPDVHILLPSLTDKDREDLKFAVDNDFDFIAASFVRKASDVEDIRAELRKHGGDNIRIIAKIENREGVENLEGIIAASDGIMVARGDLGVEIPAHEVPILQKKMIKATIRAGLPVITATQMLDSMIRNPRPTRAEVSDVANAVFDGTSCVMLSGETASGKYPIEALSTMVNTVTAAEEAIDYWGRFRERSLLPVVSGISDAITHSCCLTAMDLNASAILAATRSGYTAKVISRFRPACPIVALCQNESTRRQLAISWGVHPYLSGEVDSTDRMFSLAVDVARKENAVQIGDTVVITAGVPLGQSGTTNLIKAQIVEGGL